MTLINHQGVIQGKLRGIAGAVTQLYLTPDYIVTIGMDRYLRVYDRRDHKKVVQTVLCLYLDLSQTKIDQFDCGS